MRALRPDEAIAAPPTDQTIPPALTAEEWATRRVSYGIGDPLDCQGCEGYGYHVTPDGILRYEIGYEGCNRIEPVQRPEAMIALANHALPSNHPAKITRERIALLRAAYRNAVVLARHAQDAGDETERLRLVEEARQHSALAAALESYLPPLPLTDG